MNSSSRTVTSRRNCYGSDGRNESSRQGLRGRHPLSRCFSMWSCTSSYMTDETAAVGGTACNVRATLDIPSYRVPRHCRFTCCAPRVSTRNISRLTAKKSGCMRRLTSTRSCCWKLTCSVAAGLTPRRSREQSSRAAHQNALRSEDGVPVSAHTKTRCRRDRVSRRCCRLSDCPRSSRTERAARPPDPELHQKVVPDRHHANRPLSLGSGRGSQRSAKQWLHRFRCHYNHERRIRRSTVERQLRRCRTRQCRFHTACCILSQFDFI